jgi:hypothetical protein
MMKNRKEMKDNYELKNPRPNPFAERMKNGYTIIIEHASDDGENYETKKDGVQFMQAELQS